MINPLIDLISTVIQLYIFVIFAWVILSLLLHFDVVNRRNRFVSQLNYALNRLTSPVLTPIRRKLPDLGGIDLSPLIVVLFLGFLDNALRHYLYNL